jgi:predicted outer membrane repeat protein
LAAHFFCIVASAMWVRQANAGYTVPSNAARNTAIAVDGQCDLFEALESMNNGTPVNSDCVDDTSIYGGGAWIQLDPTNSPTYQLPSQVWLSRTDAWLAIYPGPGVAGTVTIQAPGPVLGILANTSVAISGLVLQSTPGAAGSVLFNEGVVDLAYVTIQNSNAGNYGGGGIHNDYGATLLEVTGCDIRNNHASFGGGIYNAPTATIQFFENSIVENNTATSGGGGGIYNAGSIAPFDGNIIRNNSSAGAGGGIYNDVQSDDMVEFDTTKVTNNTATGNGGGIYTDSAITISQCTLSGTVALGGGGGAFVSTNSPGGDATLRYSTLSGNTSGTMGGGLFQDGNGSQVRLNNCTVSGNTAATKGGGLYGFDYLEVVSSTIAFNRLTSQTGQGGGVYDTASAPRTNACIVAKNTHGTSPVVADDYFGWPHGGGASDARSLFGTGAGAMGLFINPVNHNNDLVGLDPLLSPLAINAMANMPTPVTMTHAIGTNSPAYRNDIWGYNRSSDDQRGYPRPACDNTSCSPADLGAYEHQ